MVSLCSKKPVKKYVKVSSLNLFALLFSILTPLAPTNALNPACTVEKFLSDAASGTWIAKFIPAVNGGSSCTSIWTVPADVSNVEVLLVAGGGGSGRGTWSGGGGAGGVVYSASESISQSEVTIQVGGGGGAGVGTSTNGVAGCNPGANGGNTFFGSLTATGGGGGGPDNQMTSCNNPSTFQSGLSGGSGGGVGENSKNAVSTSQPLATQRSPGLGNAGGAHYFCNYTAGGDQAGSGGGGAGSVGGYVNSGNVGCAPGVSTPIGLAPALTTTTYGKPGLGGSGTAAYSIVITNANVQGVVLGQSSSSSYYVAGGGTGSGRSGQTRCPGCTAANFAGSLGGGGKGRDEHGTFGSATSGLDFTGGGGGGGGGNGGSGFLLIRYVSNLAAPTAPTIGTVIASNSTTISVPYTAGSSNGSAITSYTVTSSPSIALTLTSSATANPLTYTGSFIQGQAYTFRMTSTNGSGTSNLSSSSNSITPFLNAQTVDWAPTTSLLTTNSPATPSVLATALGSASITYTLVNAGTTGCTVNSISGVLTFTTAGSCTIRASAAATSNYSAATTDVVFVISQGIRSITVTQSANGTISPSTISKNCGSSQLFTFSSDTGYSVASITIDGVALTGSALTNAVSSGYTFTNIIVDHTVSATWLPNNYTVTYDGSSPTTGSVPIDASNYNIAGSVTVLGNTGTLTKTGYIFVGWTDNIGGTETIYGPGQTTTYTVVTSNITFYAKWSPTFQTVTYALAGGTSALPTQTAVATAALFTTAATPLRAGYTFTGWSDGITTTAAATSYTMGAIEITLTARWIQTSLYGIAPADLTFAGDIRASDTQTRTLLVETELSSVSVRVPSGALPEGTIVEVYSMSNSTYSRSKVLSAGDYIVNLVVAWHTPEGAVPTAITGISVTIRNSLIKTGAKVYGILGDVVTFLGTAEIDGQVVVFITEDPIITVTNLVVAPPTTGGGGGLIPVVTPPTISTINEEAKKLDEAKTEATQIIEEAKTKADELIKDAKDAKDAVRVIAEAQSTKILEDAQTQANKILEEARAQGNEILAKIKAANELTPKPTSSKTATPKPTSSKTATPKQAASKKITPKPAEKLAVKTQSTPKATSQIICVKGALQRKIAGVKPICPSGFKKK